MPSDGEAARPLRAWPHAGVALACGLGTLLALCICVAAGQGAKSAVVVLVGLAGLGAWPLIAWFPGLVDKLLLFGIAATLSVSIKVHPLFREGHLGGSVGTRVCITDVLLLLLGAVWLCSPGRARRLKLWIDTPILVAFAVYMVFAAWSTLTGMDRTLGVFQLWAYLEAFVVFVLLSNYVTTPGRFRIAVAGLLAGLLLQSAVTVIQVERPGSLKLAFMGGQEEVEAAGGPGEIALPEWDRGTIRMQGESLERPVGLLIHPNVLGVYFVLTLPLAAAACLAGGSTVLPMLGGAAMGLGAVALYLSLSRSGWAGVAAALLLGAVLAVRWRALRLSAFRLTLVVLVGLGAVAGVVLKLGTILERLTGTLNESVAFRFDLARTAWNMLQQKLLTGVGLNTFVDAMPAYDVTGMSRIQRFPVHNIFLLEFSETGLLGGLAFMALVAVILARAFAMARTCPGPNLRLYAIGLAAGLAGFWLAELSGYVYRIPIMTTLFWGHLAMVVGAARAGRPATA